MAGRGTWTESDGDRVLESGRRRASTTPSAEALADRRAHLALLVQTLARQAAREAFAAAVDALSAPFGEGNARDRAQPRLGGSPGRPAPGCSAVVRPKTRLIRASRERKAP
jgi:hypothetical protein